MPRIRIGTRSSKLALWQAHWVVAELQQLGYQTELVHIATQGDVSSQSLSQIGGQGLFTKEIQRALLDERVDVAVHSLKDLPTLPVEGLILAAVPMRESTRDCLISRGGQDFESLPANSKIGTGSSRRAAQLLAWRNDVEILDIRGNVDSRLRKLDEGQFDAIVLAAAGMKRLELYDRVTQELPQDRVLPAVGQGALGLECRVSDETVRAALERLSDPSTYAAVTAERQLLASLLAGCLAPVAALGTVESGQLTLAAKVLAPDGSQSLSGVLTGPLTDAQVLGEQLANQLRDQGAEALIRLARG
ncbi:MAG: hydroxymethylbilane synthase [bacterium]|nr:hydroxymethylbilane synthase [bacterium]